MHILVTNDDGVQARGLMFLAQAMRALGEVTVLAPDRNWSASGHNKTMSRPLRLQQTRLEDGTAALSSDGSPSDCVALGLLGALERPIDLVISGINPFPNMGHDATYSGTIAAAMEAVLNGVPGFAFSIAPPEPPQKRRSYAHAAAEAARIVETLLPHELPEHTLMSVNFPTGESYKGWQFTRQGQRVYRDAWIRDRTRAAGLTTGSAAMSPAVCQRLAPILAPWPKDTCRLHPCIWT